MRNGTADKVTTPMFIHNFIISAYMYICRRRSADILSQTKLGFCGRIILGILARKSPNWCVGVKVICRTLMTLLSCFYNLRMILLYLQREGLLFLRVHQERQRCVFRLGYHNSSFLSQHGTMVQGPPNKLITYCF